MRFLFILGGFARIFVDCFYFGRFFAFALGAGLRSAKRACKFCGEDRPYAFIFVIFLLVAGAGFEPAAFRL